jgi:poly(A) polymerase
LHRTKGRHSTATPSHIIPPRQHNLSKKDISSNALNVLNRLNSAGFQAYLVGGSVRDLLLGKVPKDFDVATNATPTQVRNLFRNGRVIGRRFKLVHVIFHRDIIEVATFRGSDAIKQTNQRTNDQGMLIRDNVYGTLEQDAWRRDFTINSLYYNIDDGAIADFTQGINDIYNNVIRLIGDPDTRYQEDPVRMLRAIRFGAKLNFNLAPTTAEPIVRFGGLIRHVSSSRLFDETTKLYQCGEAKKVQALLLTHQLFGQLFSQTHALLESAYPVKLFIDLALESTDARIKDNKPITPAFLYAVILWFPLINTTKDLKSKAQSPLVALEHAMTAVINEQNQVIAIPKRFTQVMREIWLLQYRFSKRTGGRAATLVAHPRFRAAYDFLALRALAGDESMELAQWWTTYQDLSDIQRADMVAALTPTDTKKTAHHKKMPLD